MYSFNQHSLEVFSILTGKNQIFKKEKINKKFEQQLLNGKSKIQ
jgi:hypothetical protein